MAPIGEAYVRVLADTGKFTPDLQRKLKAALKTVEAKVKVTADTTRFATQLQRQINALKKPLKITVEIANLAAVRRELEASFKTAPIKVRFAADGVPALKREVQAELARLKGLSVVLTASKASVQALRREVQTTLAGLPPIQLRFGVTNAASLRIGIQAALRALDPIRIRLTVFPADIVQLRAQIAALLLAQPPVPIRVVINSASAVAGARSAAGSIDGIFKKMGHGITGVFKSVFDTILTGFKLVLAAVALTDVAIAAFGIKAAADFQKVEVGLQAIIGAQEDLARGSNKLKIRVGEVVDRFRELALATPLDFNNIAQGSLSLQVLGLTAEQTLGAIETIGNALALVGRASGENLQASILPILQAASTGKLLGQDLNQFSQRLAGVFNRGALLKDIFEYTNAQRKLQGQVALTRKEFDALREAEGLAAGPALNAIFKQLNAAEGAEGALRRATTDTLSGAFASAKESVKFAVTDIFLPLTEQLTKEVGNFGDIISKAFAEAGPSIQQFVTDALPVIKQLIPAFFELVVVVNGLFAKLFKTFSPLLEPILGAIKGFFKIISGAFDQITAKSGDFGNVFKSFLPFFKGIGGLVGAIFKSFLNLLPVVQTIGKGLSALKPIFDIVGAALVFITKIIGDFFRIGFVQEVGAFIVSLLALGGIFGAIAKTVKFFGSLIAKIFTNIFPRLNLLTTNIRLFGNLLFSVFRTLSATVRVLFTSVFPRISSAIGAAVRVIRNTLIPALKFVSKIALAIGLAFEKVGEAIVSALGAAFDFVLAAMQKVFEAAGHLPFVGDKFDGLATKVSELRDQLKGSATDIEDVAVVAGGAVEKASGSIQKSSEAAIKNIDAIKVSLENLPTQSDTRVNVLVQDALIRVREIQENLAAIPDKKSTDYAVAVTDAQRDISRILTSLAGIPDIIPVHVEVDIRTVKDAASGRTPAERLKLLQQGLDPDTVPLPKPKSVDFTKLIDDVGGAGSSSSGGGDDRAKSAAKSAADAAKRAAEAFRDAIQAILRRLDADFRKTLREGTSKQIDSALDGLADAITSAFKGKKTKVDDNLVKFIDAQNEKLRKLIDDPKKGRTRILKDLEKEQKALEAITARMATIVESIRSFASITNLEFGNANGVIKQTLNTAILDTAGSFRVLSRSVDKQTEESADAIKRSGAEIAQAFKDRLAQAKAFKADIEVLIARGLDRDLINQLLDQGPDAGAQTADALANASTTIIASLNRTQREIEKTSNALGTTVGEKMFDAGKSAVEGLIAGLKDKKGEIAKEIGEITNLIISRVRKDLKIKSPSRVLRKLFGYAGDGAVLGLRDSVQPVTKAAAAMASAAVPRLSPVTMDALQAAGNAESAQQLRALQGGGASGGVTAADLDRVISAVAGARPNKEIQANITQHFSSPVTPASAKMAFGTVARR